MAGRTELLPSHIHSLQLYQVEVMLQLKTSTNEWDEAAAKTTYLD